ncbi:MAG: NAD(P)H oxidoreductase [Deltaproteobacteria bacterium]|nr:NAD(P)H oxidoreductase [Deltaproteobacteria bacterium]
MNKVLILFAHPRFEKSKTNRALLSCVDGLEGVTLNDLYEQYPDFNIDIDREKDLLLQHDVILWHHPVYMYSAPAMIKQWIDVVLEYGWAHGGTGKALAGKTIFNVLTAGGIRESYAPGERNRFALREFMLPFEQTAVLCNMVYLPPFVVHGTGRLTPKELAGQVILYRQLLERLTAGELDIETVRHYDYLNDWLTENKG